MTRMCPARGDSGDSITMQTIADRVDALDLSLFQAIQSQTSEGDKRSFLVIQRAVANARGSYSYLEIGSHLGGSIQPHLLDDRCLKIYSIDPRPLLQPDDRKEGFVARYEDNSSRKMLQLLSGIYPNPESKVDCFDVGVEGMNETSISPVPDIALIDGEHTVSAALKDAAYCLDVVRRDGVILFHDFGIIWPAVKTFCRTLRHSKIPFSAYKLESETFAIIFDKKLIFSDSYLIKRRAAGELFWLLWPLSRKVREIIPHRLKLMLKKLLK